MPTSSLFRRLQPQVGADLPRATIDLDGAALTVPAGCSVAAALLAAGVTRVRTTPVSGAPRAPYCMMGVCFECLMEIDGEPNRQACLVEVRDGMSIRTQHGARDLAAGHAEVDHAR